MLLVASAVCLGSGRALEVGGGGGGGGGGGRNVHFAKVQCTVVSALPWEVERYMQFRILLS